MIKEWLKLVRLDREEIIGTVIEGEGFITIHNPLKLLEFDNQIVLAPWIPFNSSPFIRLDKSKIVYGPCDIIDELKELYKKFNEYYEINPDMKYGQFMCKASLKNLESVVEAFNKKNQEIEEGVQPNPGISTEGVTPEDLDRLMEEVFVDVPKKEKLN